MAALALEHVYIQKGNFILRDISFSVEQNEVVALQGRSGTGKTSLIETIAGANTAGAGCIYYFGRELWEQEKQIRRELSVVYDTVNFNTEYKAVRLAKTMKKIEPWFDMDFFLDNMARMQLEEGKRIRQYSKGMQKLYGTILMLSRTPKILVMDEPTSGLDEMSRKELIEMIQRYRQSHELSILFSTHNKDDVDEFAHRSISLGNGGLL